MFGQSYAALLLLANAGKSAMKVVVAARPELSEWLTFTPDFGFIQVSNRHIRYVCAGLMGRLWLR
jgi:GTPase involved in cell partitioning and DNA repair